MIQLSHYNNKRYIMVDDTEMVLDEEDYAELHALMSEVPCKDGRCECYRQGVEDSQETKDYLSGKINSIGAYRAWEY
jgi:hypothetical protein